MAFDLLSSEYLRDRAKEIREAAKICRDPVVKDELDAIAEQYAALAEERVVTPARLP